MRSKKSSPSSYPSPTERRQGAVHPLLMQLMQSKLEQHSLLLELQQASALGKSPRSEREGPASKHGTRSQQLMAYAKGADLHEVVMQALAENDVADGRPEDTPAGAGGSATAARAKEREQQQKELKQALVQCTIVDDSESSTVRASASFPLLPSALWRPSLVTHAQTWRQT
ncbi:hypothetical protein CYMTET_45554 [Cymbomonas tetramitiformis]|uniref:Uncharacterized protein n=1 Tax=Cymbomonas tetramitiformis TaxID=36881 RepID=A0AAE0EYH3_9CHLO|nr:hypothetical protein CYMTET_45554 [Cymbomonas tetramitiformis]